MNNRKLLAFTIILPLFTTVFLYGCHNTNNGTPNNSNIKDDEIEVIKDRISEEVWSQSYRYCEVSINEKPVMADEGGLYLLSIDYNSQKPAEWPVIGHLEYIMSYLRSIGKERKRSF